MLGIMSAIDGQMLTSPSGYNLAQIASDSQTVQHDDLSSRGIIQR